MAREGRAQAAASVLKLPGRYVVKGAPLARRRGVVAGRTISVYSRPKAVVLEGCRSSSVRVRARRGEAAIAAVARCKGIRGALRVQGTIRRQTLRGTLGTGRTARRFIATLRPPRGRLLRGKRSAVARRSVRDTALFQSHPDSVISRARGGARVPRIAVALRFRPNATVGQVNAALESAGGRISGSLAGSTHLLVAIPDPGSLDALETVLDGLRRRAGVRRADRTEMAAANELPPGSGAPPSGGRAAELSHLLAMGMPAAWNARAAIRQADRPTVLVADLFANGRLSPQVDADFDPGDLLSGRLADVPPISRGHGYHVVGLIAANFPSNGTPAGRATGVFPARSRLELVDVTGKDLDAAAIMVLQAMQAIPGRVVVNTSLGHIGGTADRYAREEGSDWANEVLTRGYINRMFHAGSAGNDSIEAAVNSPWAAAAVRTDLEDIDGVPIGRLANTHAVENVVDTGSPAFAPGCLSSTSNHGGTIAAVGNEVFSNLLGSNAGNLNGSSMSSPQVAGLAAYLWSIAPDLTAPQLRELLVASSDPPLGESAFCGDVQRSAPLVNAYRAVLALDQSAPLSPSSAPVRFAILNQDGDSDFDQADLAAFAAALRSTPSARDWSRFDLNGDGFTGGSAARPVDLDPNGSPRAGLPVLNTVTPSIEGVSVPYNENGVTDVQALCFYAYSGLYNGSAEGRRSALRADTDCGAALQDLSGNFEGVARDCDTNTDGSPSCGADAETFGLLQVTASGFTFFVQAEDSSIDTATCAVPGQDPNNCFKATGSSTVSPFTGTAVSRSEQTPMPFQATLTGDELRGRIDTQTDPTDPIWIEFELTRVP